MGGYPFRVPNGLFKAIDFPHIDSNHSETVLEHTRGVVNLIISADYYGVFPSSKDVSNHMSIMFYSACLHDCGKRRFSLSPIDIRHETNSIVKIINTYSDDIPESNRGIVLSIVLRHSLIWELMERIANGCSTGEFEDILSTLRVISFDRAEMIPGQAVYLRMLLLLYMADIAATINPKSSAYRIMRVCRPLGVECSFEEYNSIQEFDKEQWIRCSAEFVNKVIPLLF